MDKLIETVVLGFPNFAGLFLVLYWQRQQTERLISAVEKLVEMVIECYEKDGDK